jgi:hypothetical protein
MTEQMNNSQEESTKKEATPADIAKQLLARKKEAQARAKANSNSSTGHHMPNGVQAMRNQNNKKPNNQRKRMGV